MPKKKSVAGRSKGITLEDVVVHVQHLGQRLDTRIDALEKKFEKNMDGMEQRLNKRMDGMSLKIDANTVAIQDLSAYVNALDEDLRATTLDTLKIRRHVGMALPMTNEFDETSAQSRFSFQ
ncbi:hypothetical protein HYR82_02480 [Candidatus Peregrinibacteria bacterium]|nr:hypothetical protein [Candidatus Peregrinibacteria bacterium]